ncbi:acyl carrier protein [Variovorax saccharolyticus]|uniref:acyl carrier protein n=1 Tax=Variovorax saccharolyticus TaxID=3053516 RepID=UPI002575DA2E|nr:acyl carrier protein [Variovorax sp. J31P216]MDM0028692.1 acyl carrier protein [Variovorax sp. J31P216]
MNKKLAAILAEVFGLRVAEIQPELHKNEVGTWDSLKQMDLVMSLEREYEIDLDIPDIVRMTSVAEIMAVLKVKGVDIES